MVICTASGILTLDDALWFRRQLLNDRDFDPTYSLFADLTGVTGTDITAIQIRMLASTTIFSPDARRALIGHSGLVFGLARMFEIVRGLRGEQHIRVFRTRAEALAWLLDERDVA